MKTGQLESLIVPSGLRRYSKIYKTSEYYALTQPQYSLVFIICAEGTSQAETLAFQFDAAREPEQSRKA